MFSYLLSLSDLEVGSGSFMPSTLSDVKRQSNPRTSLDNAIILCCQGSEKMSFHPETPEDNLQKRGYSFIYIIFIMSVRDFLKYVTYVNVLRPLCGDAIRSNNFCD